MKIKMIVLAVFAFASISLAHAGWTIAQSCAGCGPATTAEFFIVGDTGAGPFDSIGIFGLDAGWSATVVNPNYVVATGPTSNMGSWVEQYFGNIADSVEINLFFWNGAPLSSLTFSADYTRSGDGSLSLVCQQFGGGCANLSDPTGVNYNRSPTNVPEPGSLALIALGLVGLVAGRRSKAA
ncbi:MAG: PEP-CTERM sorting domain-containing protein [Azonexus sp.]|nr:PEP-CTERM sorting domain-containing protein [Azonexus sp.]